MFSETYTGTGASGPASASDHADWASLLRTVKETGAKKILVTHGSIETLSRYLQEELGVDAEPLTTKFGEEED